MPVEISPSTVKDAKVGWDEGRIALNEFFVLLNTAVGLNELKPIPPPGPDQNKSYGRSARRYNELQKKIKLCQNRGGPALSQAWGKFVLDEQLIDFLMSSLWSNCMQIFIVFVILMENS